MTSSALVGGHGFESSLVVRRTPFAPRHFRIASFGRRIALQRASHYAQRSRVRVRASSEPAGPFSWLRWPFSSNSDDAAELEGLSAAVEEASAPKTLLPCEVVDVVVIGGGLAGLRAALELHNARVPFVLLEASDAVGGRVRTDQQGGFLLDRGFQIFLTAYPEAQAVLDYELLDLKPFYSGAMVRLADGSFHKVADPFRHLVDGVGSIGNPIGSPSDKVRVGLLRLKAVSKPLQDILSAPETTILEALQKEGFSDAMIDRFFRPFLGGIFFDKELSTTSRMLEFVLRMLALGANTLPAQGIGAIPLQLAQQLPHKAVRLLTPVSHIIPTATPARPPGAAGPTTTADAGEAAAAEEGEVAGKAEGAAEQEQKVGEAVRSEVAELSEKEGADESQVKGLALVGAATLTAERGGETAAAQSNNGALGQRPTGPDGGGMAAEHTAVASTQSTRQGLGSEAPEEGRISEGTFDASLSSSLGLVGTEGGTPSQSSGSSGYVGIGEVEVHLEDGRMVLATCGVIVAVEQPEASRMLGDLLEVAPSKSGVPRSTVCLYYASDRAPSEEPILYLNGTGQGLINNLCFPSTVAPGYAPSDKALVSVSLVGSHPDTTDEELEANVRKELVEWFSNSDVATWKHLRTYRIPFAQPDQQPPTDFQRAVELPGNIFVCGDHRSSATFDGALASGRAAAEALLARYRLQV